MQEQTPDQNQDPAAGRDMARVGRAAALTGVLLLGNNMPGTEYRTEQADSQKVTVEQVVDQATVNMPGNPAETVITLTPDVDNEYRVDFTTTNEDAQSSETQVVTELDKVLGAADWTKVYDIQVEGRASAEDEQTDGGLQEASEVNSNLALQRALIAAQPVVEAFKAKGIDVSQPVQKDANQPAEAMMHIHGVEDSWSDADLEKATDFSGQFGYDNVEEMVEHYNDGGTPPAVEEFLKPLLEDQRGATVTLKLRGSDGAEESVTVTTVENIIKVEQTSTESQAKEVVNNQNIGVLSAPVAVPVRRGGRQAEYPPYRDKFTRPTGNGQKPVRHRGRTHMTNPTPM